MFGRAERRRDRIKLSFNDLLVLELVDLPGRLKRTFWHAEFARGPHGMIARKDRRLLICGRTALSDVAVIFSHLHHVLWIELLMTYLRCIDGLLPTNRLKRLEDRLVVRGGIVERPGVLLAGRGSLE